MAHTGIYKIQSIRKRHKIYIGSAVNIMVRWQNHLSLLSRGKHPNNKLQNHYNKYGKVDLEFEILICCDRESLIPSEQFYIDAFNPWFNLRPTAQDNTGFIHSEITKKKISTAKKGKPIKKGRHLTDEHKRKLSESHKGKQPRLGSKHTEETKRKLSEINKLKQPISKEIREKMNETRRGKPHPHKRKNRDINLKIA